MSGSDDVAAFLPSLEMARAAKASVMTRVWWRRRGVDLLQREPTFVQKVAALVTMVHRRGEPRVTLLRYPYVPAMPFVFEEGTARLFAQLTDALPECLRVETERRGGGAPYRGMPSATPSFHGFDYSEPLAQMRAKLHYFRATEPPGSLDVETYAWPILRLTYCGRFAHHELALLVRPDRVLHALMFKGSWP